MYLLDYKINTELYPLRDELLRGYIEYLTLSSVNVTTNKIDLATKAISCILLNINIKHGSSKIGITLDRSSYSKGSIINGQYCKRKVSYEYTRSVLDYMISKRYIELVTGGLSAEKEDWGFVDGKWQCLHFKHSYIIVKESLRVKIPKYSPHKLLNVVRLKDSNKKYVTYKTPKYMRNTVKFQSAYNDFSLKFNITISDERYYVQSYKVFNINFGRGGRSFMEGSNTIQSVSKEKRSSVLVNGMACSCFDYHGFELALLYTMNQEVFEGDDFYRITLDGYDSDLLKKICKGFTLRMINCESETAAAAACREYIAKDFNVEFLYNQRKIPDPRIDVQLIMKAIEAKHHIVVDSFYNGVGGELQYAGSLINDYLLDYFMQRGVLVIQVHDAFIVTKEHEADLQVCMKRAFVDVLGFDDNVKITKEF